jgi:hypothetical protein
MTTRKRLAVVFLIVGMVQPLSAAAKESPSDSNPKPVVGRESNTRSVSAASAALSPGRQVSTLVSRLYATDETEVRGAVAELGKRRDRAAIIALADFLRAGQADAVADYALEILGKTGSGLAYPTLLSFTFHRRASARLIAYRAIAANPQPGTVAIISGALSDSDASVRGAAAVILASLRARDQVPRLLLALDRGVPEAAASIGQLGNAESARNITKYINKYPLSILLNGYRHFLERTDIGEKTELEIVATLADLAVPEVKAFFQSFLEAGGAKGRPVLQKAIEVEIKRIKSGPATQLNRPTPTRANGQGAKK